MKKQTINIGYITYALTDSKGEIYGIIESEYIDFTHNSKNSGVDYYWSIVLKYERSYHIIRRGMLLSKATEEELQERHKQSKINLH